MTLTLESLNTSFSEVFKNIKIPEYENYDPIADNIQDPL